MGKRDKTMNKKSIFRLLNNYAFILLITIFISGCAHKSGKDALAIFSISSEAKFDVGHITISRDIPTALGSDKIYKNEMRAAICMTGRYSDQKTAYSGIACSHDNQITG